MKLITFFLTICLGLSVVAQNRAKFENSTLEWLHASGISDKRINEVAPHFPNADKYETKEQFEVALLKWQKLYCFEYEAFVNAPELTALNPFYTGYLDIIQMPYFIRPLNSYDKPVKKNTGNSLEDELEFELDVQAWYYVFHPNEFYKIYKIKPAFPEFFNPEVYRAQIIQKIEASKTHSE